MPDLKSKIEALLKEVRGVDCYDGFSANVYGRMVEILELMLALAEQASQPQLAFIGDCEECGGKGWGYDDDGDEYTCRACKGQGDEGPTELGKSVLELLEWHEKKKASQNRN